MNIFEKYIYSFHYSYLSEAEYYTAGGGTGYIFLDDVSCTGHEASLSSCGHNGWGSHNCGHSEDVGVRCFDEKEGTNIFVEESLSRNPISFLIIQLIETKTNTRNIY